MHAHLLLFLTQLRNDCHNFLDEWAASMNLYYRKSATLVLKLSQGVLYHQWSQGTTPHKFMFPVQAAITLMVTSEWGYSIFVCACLQTQSMMELNQKLTKAPWEDAQYGVFINRKNTYVRTWEGVCSMGRIFGNLRYLISEDLDNRTFRKIRFG